MRWTSREIGDFVHISSIVGGCAALYSLAGAISAIFGNNASALWLLEGPALSFGIWFGFFFVVQITGAARWEGSRLVVGPGLSALVIGCWISFIAGLILDRRWSLASRGRIVAAAGWTGILALGWTGLLAVVWASVWLFTRRRRLTRV